MPTPISSAACQDSGTIAPTMNCAQNSPNSNHASRTEIDRLAKIATANNDCAAVRNSSSRCCAVDRQPVQAARGDREDDRQRADQQRPLVHLRRDQRPEARVGVEPPRVEARHQQLGRLRRQRREPLHQEELADADIGAGRDQRLGEVLRADRITAAAKTNITTIDVRRGPSRTCRGSARDRPGAAPRPAPSTRGSCTARRSPPAPRVERRDRVLQRQGQRVDRGDGQVRELHRVAPVELDALPPLRGGAPSRLRIRYHAMNTTMDQPMPISSRLAPVMFASASDARRLLSAARRRQARRTRRLERVPALPGEHEVDRVLGEDGDERQHGDRESGGDVELRDLRRPRQHERRAHDRQPEQRGLERSAADPAWRPEHQRRHGSAIASTMRDALARRMDVGELVLVRSTVVPPAFGRRSRPRPRGGSPGRDARP